LINDQQKLKRKFSAIKFVTFGGVMNYKGKKINHNQNDFSFRLPTKTMGYFNEQ